MAAKSPLEGRYRVDVIAGLLSISERRVQQLAKSGVIPKATRGLYDLVPCLHAYLEQLRGAASGHRAEYGDLDLTAERARLAKEQADAQELKNAVTRGELVEAAEVVAVQVAVATAIRTRVLSLKTRVSHEVAEATEPGQCSEIIDRAVREILEEVANAEVEATDPGG